MKKKFIILVLIAFITMVSSGFCAFLFIESTTSTIRKNVEGMITVEGVVQIGEIKNNQLVDGYENYKIVFASGDVIDSLTSDKGIEFMPYISVSYQGYANNQEEYDLMKSKYNFYYYITFSSTNSKLFGSDNPYAFLADEDGQSYEKKIPFEISSDNDFKTILTFTPSFHYLPNRKPFNEADYLALYDAVVEDSNKANNVKYNIKFHIVAEVKW